MQTSHALETLIREHPFLDGLKAGFVDFFQESASVRRFASHQTIFQEGGGSGSLLSNPHWHGLARNFRAGPRASDDSETGTGGSAGMVLAVRPVPVAIHRDDPRTDGSHFL